MVFWLAVLVGGLFAWIAVRIGFYATWIMFFNLVLSAYVAIFLTPVIIAEVPAATAVEYGHAMTLLSIAVATLAIAYGTCFAVLAGQLRMDFPKVFDNTVAGVLGFLTGFLVWSFAGFVFCVTPLSKNDFSRMLHLDAGSQTTTTSYVCWWCNRLHSFTATSGVDMTSEKSVDKLLHQAGTAPEEQTKPSTLVLPASPQAPPSTPGPPAPPTIEPLKTESGKTEGEKTPPNTAAESEAIKKNESKTPGGGSNAPADSAAATQAQPVDEELGRHRAVIDSPAAVQAAVTDPKITIIEVGDKCLAGQFDAEQTGLLQAWVSKGGVLWVHNKVLMLFGVPFSVIPPSDDSLTCVASTAPDVASVVVDCKKVVLKGAGDKAAIDSSKTALPLLVTEKNASEKEKPATPRWSLVPYGKGWLSDPKPIDMAQYDGAVFWQNFCQLCLKKELLDLLPRKSSSSQEEPPAPVVAPQPASSLSGIWKTSTGALLRLEDDGKGLTIDLAVTNEVLLVLTGRLTRHDEGGDQGAASFTGTLDTVFAIDAPKQHVIDVTITTGEPGHLRLRCPNWPRWYRGKIKDKAPLTDILTRSEVPPAKTSAQPENPFTTPPVQ